MKRSLGILVLYSLILLVSEYCYRLFFHIPLIEWAKLPENLGFIFVIISLFYFAKFKAIKVFIFLFFAVSVIGNNIHYEIYRSWITGINYFLAFKEFDEVTLAGAALLEKLIPHILWGAVDCLIFLSVLKFRNKTAYAADILFVLLLVFTSVKSISVSQETVISPKQHYGRVKEHYLAFGHLWGRVIPNEVLGLSNVPQYIHPQPNKIANPQIKNIIFIMGESETSKHLSVFGYDRPTTPFFERIQREAVANNGAVLKEAYSAGVLTILSLPPFFNAVPYPNGAHQMNSGETNFFRLAQMQGYHTYFYSAQAENQMGIMNLIGKRWIDDLRFPTDLGFKISENMPDEKLLPLFSALDLDDGNNVIVLHQRASHMPYGMLLQEEDQFFGNETLLDKYDNTILKTDQFIQRVFEELQKRGKDDWLLVYTSDHGQYVTESVNNQGTSHPDNYTVPIFAYSPISTVNARMTEVFSRCEKATHQQLITYLIAELGYDMSVADCNLSYINSDALSGDLGYLEVRQPDQIRLIDPHKK